MTRCRVIRGVSFALSSKQFSGIGASRTRSGSLFADVDSADEVCQGAPGSVVSGVVCELPGAHLFGECGDHFRTGSGAAQHDGHR